MLPMVKVANRIKKAYAIFIKASLHTTINNIHHGFVRISILEVGNLNALLQA